MKTKELFEEVRGRGFDVSLSSGIGTYHLTTNIQYNDILNTHVDADHPDYVRQMALWIAEDADPSLAELKTQYLKLSADLVKETESEIGQLIQAYKNMVYGLIVLMEKQKDDFWKQNIAPKIPQEVMDKVTKTK